MELLRSELEPNLGLAGAGQEVSILRSTLIRTGILDTKNGVPKINLHPHDYLMANLLGEIEKFVQEAQEQKMSFAELYARLTTDKCYIGLRKGLVPIYVAAVFHEYKKEISSLRQILSGSAEQRYLAIKSKQLHRISLCSVWTGTTKKTNM